MVLLICQGASIKCDESLCPALTALVVLDYATYAPRVGWETWCLHGLRATSFGRRGDRIVGAFFGRRFFSMRDISEVSCSAKETGADVGGATHTCAHRSLRKLWFPKRGCSWWASISGCGLEVLREESGRGNLLRSRCASAQPFVLQITVYVRARWVHGSWKTRRILSLRELDYVVALLPHASNPRPTDVYQSHERDLSPRPV